MTRTSLEGFHGSVRSLLQQLSYLRLTPSHCDLCQENLKGKATLSAPHCCGKLMI